MSILGLLPLLAFLILAWVGSLPLRKAVPQSGAKLLFIGCVTMTVGAFLALALGLVATMNNSGYGVPAMLGLVGYLAILLGLLVFMIGFALHGLQIGRVVERITELETVAAAQQEEIERLQTKG